MNTSIPSDLSDEAEQDAANQAKLIARFELPANAKNVALFSWPVKSDYEMYFEGRLEWEIEKQEEVYNPLTRQNELTLAKQKFSRELTKNFTNWITVALS